MTPRKPDDIDDEKPHSVSCDGVAVDAGGKLFTLGVYTNGEGFNSYVNVNSDVGAGAGDVKSELLNWNGWLIDLCRDPSGRLFACDIRGRIAEYDGGTWSQTDVSPGDRLVRFFALSDTEIFACGNSGIVYQRNARDAWSASSPRLGDTIFAIGGTSIDNLYAVGEAGLAWWKNGAAWQRIDLPTNARLLHVYALGVDDVVICGLGGTLFRGAGMNWTDITSSDLDLHCLAVFQGTTYVAAGGEGLFALIGGSLQLTKKTFQSYKIIANDAYLGSAGGAIGMRFDGKNWFGTRYV